MKRKKKNESIDRDWQAEGDADTLRRAEEIREDSGRLKKAIDSVKSRRDELDEFVKQEAGLRGSA